MNPLKCLVNKFKKERKSPEAFFRTYKFDIDGEEYEEIDISYINYEDDKLDKSHCSFLHKINLHHDHPQEYFPNIVH